MNRRKAVAAAWHLKTFSRCFFYLLLILPLQSTVGASFTLKMWGKYNVAIWDTAGQERYIGLSSFYCRNADVAIMAFDITNRESYKALMTRYVELLHMVDDFALKVVVGTKTDLLKDYKRQVSSAEAEMFARNLNHTAAKDKAPYFETSSATGNNIETVFEYIVERCYPGSPMLSCCLRQTHEQEHKSVALTPRVLRFAKTTAGCCL
uniref:Putative rab subfamily protein of small gtpase n=1 Tax=Ixodes ricinus TaxID=34613 RepID=A0A0K8RM67_IXORI